MRKPVAQSIGRVTVRMNIITIRETADMRMPNVYSWLDLKYRSSRPFTRADSTMPTYMLSW